MLQPRDLKGRTAISYTRWSSGRQTEGDSLRRQTAAAEEFCASFGLTMNSGIVDSGVSAFKGGNLDQGLGRFMSGVKSGDISSDTVLLLEAMDRFSRQNHMDAKDHFEGLLKLGVTIVTLVDRQVHTWEAYRSNVMLPIMSLLAMKAANDYSDKISKRVGEEWNNRAARARQGRVRMSKVPFWIDQQTQGFNARVDDARLIFRLAKDGQGQNAITQQLNEKGIPSSRGGTWGKSMVADVIKSKAA